MITNAIVLQKISSVRDFAKSHSGNDNIIAVLSVIELLTLYCRALECRINSLENINEKNECINHFLKK